MDYYCGKKFTDLLVHVQSRLLYNCCKAYPERVDIKWLQQNPGRLFNTDIMTNDRKLMLDNKSCESCYYGCYKLEEQGLTSARQNSSQSIKKESPHAHLQNLQISLTTDCNLACIYCSPEWSTTWQREIKENGNYQLASEKISNSNWSELWTKTKQKTRGQDSKFFLLLLNEIKLSKDLKKIQLLGGEPLLNNDIDKIFENAEGKKINIITGLGVNDARLQKILASMKGQDVSFGVSGESTGKYFDFIRHGLTWQDFQRRVSIIQQHGKEVEFLSTITNLSVLDFENFNRTYGGLHTITIDPVTNRPYLSAHVLDEESKETVRKKLSNMGNNGKQIVKMIDKDPTDTDRFNLGLYLKQLSARRRKSLDFLPSSLLEWSGANA